MPADIVVLGSLNVDVVTRVAALPKPGETIIGLGLDIIPGGKGLNQAVAAARLGASVAMLGAIGDDSGGAMLKAVLDKAGVDTAGVRCLAGKQSGQAHICVSNTGENTIVVTPGVNGDVTPDFTAMPGGVPAIVICQFETPLAALESFLVNASGALRIINAAPANSAYRHLFQRAEIVVVNETELAAYAGVAVDSADRRSVVHAARVLIAASGQTIIVTLGAAGCIAVTADDAIAAPGQTARVVDTTGAGDCFCAALAVALSRDARLDDAMAFANCAASVSVESLGAATSMPTRAIVEARLQESLECLR